MSDRAILAKLEPAPPLTLPTWAVGVPVVLLLGFLTLLGRAGVGIRLFGLPLGAYLTPVPTFLVGLLLVSRRGRALLSSLERPQRRVAIAVGIAVGAGLLRAATQGTPTLLRFQDMAYLLHLPWIIVGMVAINSLRSDDERFRVLRWIAWTLTVVLTLHWARGAIAPVTWLFDLLVDGLGPLSDKPDLLLKDGDLALYGVALAALALGLCRATAPAWSLIVLAGALVGTHLSLFTFGGSRGALLGMLVGLTVLVAQRGSRVPRTVFTGMAVLTLAVSASSLLISVPPAAAPAVPDSPVSRPGSAAPSLRESYEAIAGRRAVTATVEQVRLADGTWVRPSEVSWRIDIWTDVIVEWSSSWRNRAFGIGFGNDIAAMTINGRQGFDGLNRGVHSIAFTILARQGVLGVLNAVLLLLALVTVRGSSKNLVLPMLAAGIIVGLFDVFLEGSHAPMMLWTVVGLSHGASETKAVHRASISSNNPT